jgi:uncharacterized protein (DUF2252 family)
MSPGVLAPPREVLTPDEWRRRGRQRRKQTPRGSHAAWEPPKDRPDPVAILEEQSRSRVPELVPIRYGRMLVSQFTYFRGAAAPMAWDLAHTPTSGIEVQACGDAHLLNFGMYAAPDRRMVFDVNDFDETLPAPFEWDLKRLAASFAVAARDSEFTENEGREAARMAVASYRDEMAKYAGMRFLELWYSRIDINEATRVLDRLQPDKAVQRRQKDIAKARRRTSLKAFLKMCDLVDGHYRIRPAHPFIVRIPESTNPHVHDVLREAVAQYLETVAADRREVLRHFYFGDFARKVVGVGSVGTEAFVMLLLGDRPDEPLFLQLKEAQESVLAPFAGKSEFAHQGQRVVTGQQLTQATHDPFLGWTSAPGTTVDPDGAFALAKDYYVRQLRDMKGSMSVSLMDPDQLRYYGKLCGWTLARAHARTGRANEIAGYLGSGDRFDRAVADFAVAYADQNWLDYQRLRQAVSSARLLATVKE